MVRLAQFCLMAEIILAPVMLGGGRPWAIAVLAILTGVGLIAICWRMRSISLPRYVIGVWLFAAIIVIWMIIQASPVWPDQSFPFDVPFVALYPAAWINHTFDIIWLCATVTLISLIAQKAPNGGLLPILHAIIIACTLQMVLALGNAVFDAQTTFWFAKTAHIGDWTGSLANRSAFGGLMGIGYIASIYLFMVPHTNHRHAGADAGARHHVPIGRRLDQSGGYLALAILFVAALTQSHSRLAFALVLIATFFLIGFARHPGRSTRVRHWGKLLFAGFCVIGIGLVTSVSVPELVSRFHDLTRFDLIQRDDAWATALRAISDRPFIGFGPDSIALVMGHFATPELNKDANWFSTHNLWLDGAIVLGVPVVLALAIAVIFSAALIMRATWNQPFRGLVIAVISLFLTSTIFDWVIGLPALILPVVAILGAGFEASIARHRASSLSAGHAGQATRPGQTGPHAVADHGHP